MRVGAYAWALLVIAAFVAVQAVTSDYGHRIDNLPHIARYEVGPEVADRSALDRPTVVGESLDRESPDLWMVRYKLYSTDADEMTNVMALARLKRDPAALDPGFFQYGGAWLYPLGVWYFGLSRLGVIEVGGLESFLDHPDRMDAVYHAGRLLVVLAVAVAGWLLYVTLARLAPPGFAVSGLAVFLFAPATLMFSQTMKPHWFALMWACGALLLLVRAAQGERWSAGAEVGLGVLVGLCFASATTYAPFTVLGWLGLAALAWSGRVPVRTLVTVPAVALAAWALTNPHVLLHWEAFRFEAANAAGWFRPELSWASLSGFVWNSGLRGFGVAAFALAVAVAAVQAVRPSAPAARGLGLALLGSIVFVSWLTANMASWHINARYLPYFLPLALVLLALVRWPWRTVTMAVVALLTVVQSVPLALAYLDEDDPDHSTRLRAAAWVHDTIPAGTGLCLSSGTPAPYDAPPIDFRRYEIQAEDCRYRVVVERETVGRPPPEGWTVERRFHPRLSSPAWPLVFGHINPPVTVYRRSVTG